MRQYYVTYDYLIDGKYRQRQKRVFANNAKEACQTIKNNYWEHVEVLREKHRCTTNVARKMTHWPFHLRAERM